MSPKTDSPSSPKKKTKKVTKTVRMRGTEYVNMLPKADSTSPRTVSMQVWFADEKATAIPTYIIKTVILYRKLKADPKADSEPVITGMRK